MSPGPGAPAPVTVRTATPSENDTVATVLGRAFADDPVFEWMSGKPQRYRSVYRVFRFAAHHAADSCDLALDRHGVPVGASMWDPPGFRPSAARSLLALPLWAAVYGRRLPRGVRLESASHQHRPKQAHWYLAAVGALQGGRGIGSALLRHRLETIDTPAYLESSNEANIPLYQRFGFEITAEIDMPDGPRLWGMLRPAP